ncbi:NADH:flavin oxidoreductase / NADH oxidase family [Geosmithia morbida]|uniref:NADH:flavin oxidoreductase / NADH oxidase family n=1 Tax=Geosmithia morbida TaxID=1094350 RepID=A0A9P5D7K3_9HYPO|nr:NADH:flavin oxidoreductase / NADH oxidase family [Geosmithia morbida]KAF4125870.1 NADH:flavin oxidoreductase / NADH oxidase family [Geosmithia morbida]
MPVATTPPPAFAALESTPLFAPFKLGSLALKHRIVQAPNTRMRCDVDSQGVNIPGPRVVKYYSDRASDGGLQITEATDICRNASGYPRVPGVFTDSQLQGWRKVTDAVHAKGGFIYVQLWYTGRASSSGLRGGETPVSSSDVPMNGNYLDGTACKDGPPRPLTVDEINDLTREWGAASKRAVEVAGFDGVEIHGANGYLLEQFLHDNINKRTDEFGGSIENRARFVLNVIKSVSDAIGPDRVGIRLSPYNYFQDTRDSDPNTHWAYLCNQIALLDASHRPAYVHMIEPRFDEVLDEEQKLASLDNGKKITNSLNTFRDILRPSGVSFIACGNFDRDNAVPKLKAEEADLIAFGRQFISNPDYVERLRNGWPLNAYDRSTFYGADPLDKGYNDYPFYDKEAASSTE